MILPLNATSPPINAITVCVDYADILALTLPYTRHHFHRFMVVTHPRDTATIRLATEFGCDVHQTEAFYAHGAHFAKWAALEEGFDALGRDGWICVLDADIAWPTNVPDLSGLLRIGNLYGPRRRMMRNMWEPIPEDGKWRVFPIYPSQEFAGWCQLFHADDPHLTSRPWYQTDWNHAGGADTFFARRWPDERHVRLPFEVLHLGQEGVNWCGRSSRYVSGELPEDSEKRRKTMVELLSGRRRSGSFEGEKVKRSDG